MAAAISVTDDGGLRGNGYDDCGIEPGMDYFPGDRLWPPRRRSSENAVFRSRGRVRQANQTSETSISDTAGIRIMGRRSSEDPRPEAKPSRSPGSRASCRVKPSSRGLLRGAARRGKDRALRRSCRHPRRTSCRGRGSDPGAPAPRFGARRAVYYHRRRVRGRQRHLVARPVRRAAPRGDARLNGQLAGACKRRERSSM